jgi:hypothetical protein
MSGRVISADPLNEKKKVGLQQVGVRSHQESNSSSNPLQEKTVPPTSFIGKPILGTVFSFRYRQW